LANCISCKNLQAMVDCRLVGQTRMLPALETLPRGFQRLSDGQMLKPGFNRNSDYGVVLWRNKSQSDVWAERTETGPQHFSVKRPGLKPLLRLLEVGSRIHGPVRFIVFIRVVVGLV
jgi:hypothetical protein